MPFQLMAQGLLNPEAYADRHFQLSKSIFNLQRADISVSDSLKEDYKEYQMLKTEGNYSKALEKAEFLIEYNESENWYNDAWILENKGNLLFEMGLYPKAEEIFLNIISTLDDSLKTKRHPFYVPLYNSLANLYFSKGQYNLAFDYTQQAWEIENYMNPKGEPRLIMAFDVGMDNLQNLMGICRLKLGQLDSADKHFKKAIEENALYFGKNAEMFKSKIYSHQALSELLKNDLDSAIKLIDRSINYSQGKFKLQYGINKGLLLLANEGFSEADKHFKGLYPNRSISQNSLLNSRLKTHIAFANFKMGNSHIAQDYLKEAIQLNFGGNDLSSDNFNQVEDAMLLLEQIRLKIELEAGNRNNYQLADELIMHLRKSFSRDADKIKLSALVAEIYQIIITEYYQGVVNNQEKADSLFYFIEQNKGSQLMQALAATEAIKMAGIPDSLVEQDEKLRAEITRYQQTLGNADSNQFDLKTKLFEKKKEHENLLKNLEREYPKYYQLKYTEANLTLKQLQDFLPDSTEILSQSLLKDDILWYSITAEKVSVKLIKDKKKQEKNALAFRNSILYKSKQGFAKLGHEIYEDLLAPIIDNEKSQKVIIPEGIYAILPFEALLQENANGKDYHEMKYLLTDFSISYSYSARLFYKGAKKEAVEPEVSSLKNWIAFAPIFDQGKKQNSVDANDRSAWKVAGFQNRESISPLPGTEEEVKNISSLLNENDWKVKTSLRKNANEKMIKELNAGQNSIVHLATHGFSHAENPAASGLICSTIDDEQDGILFSREIYNLNWDADLVVMSACETGLGKIVKGEGILGLTRALLYAGTKNMVVSLWKVSDAGTASLMQSFYRNIAENSQEGYYANSLQKSKISMIKNKEFAAPYYWSAFVLVGW
ncbi:MAG: CHAT domain-containing protein [Bacteroidota bacterium]